MKLLPYQQDAYDDFKSFGYAIIEGPRRSGKTTFLQYVAQKTKEPVLLIVPNYAMYKQLGWADIKNVRRVTAIPKNAKGVVIIGDEIELYPDGKNKIVCAYTRPYITHKWSLKNNLLVPKDAIDHLKKEMTIESFRREIY